MLKKSLIFFVLIFGLGFSNVSFASDATEEAIEYTSESLEVENKLKAERTKLTTDAQKVLDNKNVLSQEEINKFKSQLNDPKFSDTFKKDTEKKLNESVTLEEKAKAAETIYKNTDEYINKQTAEKENNIAKANVKIAESKLNKKNNEITELTKQKEKAE
jgi:hypothetical protein